jgi:hypothetical protein
VVTWPWRDRGFLPAKGRVQGHGRVP